MQIWFPLGGGGFGKCALRMIIVLNQNLSKEYIWLENEICKYKNGVWTTKWRSERHNQEFKTFCQLLHVKNDYHMLNVFEIKE